MTPEEYLILVQLLQQVLSLIAGQQGNDARLAVESSPYRIQTYTDLAWDYLHDDIVGLPALLAAVARVRLDESSPHVGTISDVLDAIAAMPLVTLPEVPPPGYGPGDVVSVWGEVFGTYTWCEVD